MIYTTDENVKRSGKCQANRKKWIESKNLSNSRIETKKSTNRIEKECESDRKNGSDRKNWIGNRIAKNTFDPQWSFLVCFVTQF